jgi:hypothetical protein
MRYPERRIGVLADPMGRFLPVRFRLKACLLQERLARLEWPQ